MITKLSRYLLGLLLTSNLSSFKLTLKEDRSSLTHVEELLSKFVDNWNQEIRDCQEAILDYTWPSISLCELILMRLVGKKELQDIETELVSGAAAYCTEFIKQIWKLSKIESSIQRSEKVGIILTAIDSGGSNRIKIEEVLREVIRSPQYPLRIFSNYSRNISTPLGIIAPTVLGIVLGLHPEFDGYWAKQQEGESKERVDRIVKVISRSITLNFDRLFPDQSSLFDEEMFFNGAIYPPVGMRERYPLLERSSSFCSWLQSSSLSKEQIVELGQRLLASPDYQVSALGLVIVGAFEINHPARILSLSERFGFSAGFLRPAVLEFKKQFQVGKDWTNSIFEDEAIALFKHEDRLGLLPYIYSPTFDAGLMIENQGVRTMYGYLANGDLTAGMAVVSDIILNDPKLIGIRIQKIYLEILTGAVDDADLALRALLTEPGAEEDWRVYSLLAITALRSRRFEDLIRYVELAYQLCPPGDERFGMVCNDYAGSLIGLKEYELALQVIEQGISSSLDIIPLYLSKLALLRAKKRSKEASLLLRELVKISPLDPRVFTERFFRPTI